MTKQNCIESYIKQDYKLQEIGLDQKLPKALMLKDWQNLPTNTNIGPKNMFAVIQEDNKLVIDIDNSEFIYLADQFLDKTLVVKTGNDGRHIYLKDITRIEKYMLTTKDLYFKDKHIGELKAHKSYVVGCGSSYIEDGITKEYVKLSSIDEVAQIDVYETLNHLGLTLGNKTQQQEKESIVFVDGPKEGSRNNECFKVACDIFEKRKLDYKAGLDYIKTWNSMSEKPLDKSEIETIVKSAYGRIENKDETKEVDIYAIADQIMAEYYFITLEGYRNKETLVYVDGIYKKFGEDIISKRSRRLHSKIRNSHIAEIKGIIKDETGYQPRDIFDKKPYMITVKNKTVNLKSGEIIEHSPKLLSRVKIPVYYDEKATCPRFDKFLESSLENDEEKITTIWENMAYCFIKDNTLLEKAFMHTGKGSNGKSILFGILTAMIGLENMTALSIHDFEADTHAISAIENILANICADVGSKGIYETSPLKKIISGDPVNSNRKFFDSYPFLPYCTLVFSANEIPEVEDKSDAFARRFILIEWEKQFFGKDRDHSVKNIRNTPSELSGIFNKILPIAKRLLQEHKLRYEPTVEDAKLKWIEKSDSTTKFLEDKCSRGASYFLSRGVLFGEYNKFAESHDMTPLSDKRFNKKLEKLGLVKESKRVGSKTERVWIGITLSSELKGENNQLG